MKIIISLLNFLEPLMNITNINLGSVNGPFMKYCCFTIDTVLFEYMLIRLQRLTKCS
jgi:hypothetical protein